MSLNWIDKFCRGARQLQTEVGLPGPDERFAIVKRYMAPFSAADETVETLASALSGASPALIREGIESVKRDLVLGPEIGHSLAPEAVFRRIRAAMAPANDMPTPPLWDEDRSDDALAAIARAPWPPVLEPA